MGRLAKLAERHYQAWLPDAYAQVDDKPSFFQMIEDEAERQIEELTTAYAGEPPEGETFEDAVGRIRFARFRAESQVMREVVLLDPAGPDGGANYPATDANPETSEDKEFMDALASFQSLRAQAIAEIQAANTREGPPESQ